MKLTADEIYRLKMELQEEVRIDSPDACVPLMVIVRLVAESETIEEVKAKYRRMTAPKARGEVDHIPDAKEMVAGHFVGVNKKAECEACKGRGWMPLAEGSAVCEKCEGRGET